MTSSSPRAHPRAVRGLALAALLFAFSASQPARAQRTAQDIESARQLYNQGIELRDKGDTKGALDKFRAAHALGNTPLTGLELCRMHVALRQPVEAREVCLGVGRIPPFAQETQRSQEARGEARRIAEEQKSKIGSLRIRVTGVPAGWEPTVIVDGAAVPPAALGEPRAVDPGAHLITARVGSGVETKATLEVSEGEAKELEIGVRPPPEGQRPGPAQPAGTHPPESAKAEKKSNTFATVSFTVGGVAALVGIVSGLAAMSSESDLEKKCANKQCGRELHADLDSAETLGNVSTAFFVIAGVAVGAGLVSMIASASSRSGSLPARTAATPVKAGVSVTPVFGLGGAGLHGSF
jgi:hypothetical protein